MSDNIVLPYRALTQEERKFYSDMARKMGSGKVAEEKIWMTTRPAGLDVVRKIAYHGYRISPNTEWAGYGSSEDGDSETVKIYHQDALVGFVGLWEEWGFLSNPVQVLLEGSAREKHVDLVRAISLADNLKTEGIDFEFSPSIADLHRESASLRKRQETVDKYLDVIGKRGYVLV